MCKLGNIILEVCTLIMRIACSYFTNQIIETVISLQH